MRAPRVPRPAALPVLPSIVIHWDQATVTGTFIQYNIYRRLPGEAWVRIGTVSTVTVTRFVDWACAAHTYYEYTVTQTETIGVDTLESAYSTVAHGTVDFDWAYLHSVDDPSVYVPLYSLDITEQVKQDTQVRGAWGRSQPTMFLGDLDFSVLRVNMLPDVQRGNIWTLVREMLTLQPDAAAIFCLRIGESGQKFFVNIDTAQRGGFRGQYDSDLSLVEVHYSEAV